MGTNVQDVAARAKQLISERKYREAVRACRRVLLSKPDSVEVRLLLAQALLALGRHDEVRIEMQTLTRRSPSTGAAHRLLGEAYLRAGNKIDATRSLKQALLLDASDEEARELLEELDEVESPPMDTIDRWFGEDEPQTVEMSLDAHAPPATPPDLPNEPTVQVDPGIVGESKPAPRQKRTMIGMQAVTAPLEAPSTIVAKPPVAAPAPPAAPTAPKPISALAPTSPLPPQATATGRIRQRPGKRTMMGMPAFAPGAPPAPPVAPPPAASPPAASPAVPPSEEELASEDLMLEEAPAPIPRGATKELDSKLLPSSTEELSAEDLAPLASGPLAPSSTEELSAEDLAPLASRPSSTEELSDGDLSPLPPLEGEATQALLPSGLDALDDVPTHARPEEKTRTRSPSIADVPDRASFEDATHAARPGAKAPAPSFPSDPVEGPPGTAPLGTEPLPGPIGTEPLADVPLLSGEATRVPSEPIGLPPSAPASVPGPLPAMPSDLKPSRQPTGPMPVATP
ncbi:MAG: tetratricopeptide repeat protein, partial [Myxococcota bacterium]